MKRIRINAGKVGLVFRNGDYQYVLKAGVHWIGWFEKVVQYKLSESFKPIVDMNLLLRDERLKDMLNLIEVKDNEIVIIYANGIFDNILSPGQHAFWKGLVDWKFVKVDLSKYEITEDINPNLLDDSRFSPYVRTYHVNSYEKALLYVNDKFLGLLDSGTYRYWKNSIPIKVDKVDMRNRVLEISGQEILTSDKAGLRINLMATYRVKDIEKALVDCKDYEKQFYVLLQLALREYIGKYNLDELMESKNSISTAIRDSVREKVDEMGIEVYDCGIRDIILPGEVKDIMNQVLVAQKKAQANVIMRREETASTRSLLNTAKLMEDNNMLYTLKEMEYVEKIAEKIGKITVAGNGKVIDQLKSIFTPNVK